MSDHAQEHDEHTVGHIVPVKLMFSVLMVLMFLTIVTVLASELALPSPLNVIVAMIIASVKATIVAMYFMHLRWDKPFNSYILIASVVFAALFIGFCMVDTREYRPAIDPVGSETQEGIEKGKKSILEGNPASH